MSYIIEILNKYKQDVRELTTMRFLADQYGSTWRLAEDEAARILALLIALGWNREGR